MLKSHSVMLKSHSAMLKSHSAMLISLQENVEIMKMDIEFIKGGLKKKVDFEEFEALGKRVAILEAKLRQGGNI